MDDLTWRRHANPWSVWTRFAAIPAGMLAVWSRVWLGWWCLVPIGVVVVWLYLNVKVFAPIGAPSNWVSRGILGEQLWFERRVQLPRDLLVAQRWLIAFGFSGTVLIVWGLTKLELVPAVLGALVLSISQVARLRRFASHYEHLDAGSSRRSTPTP